MIFYHLSFVEKGVQIVRSPSEILELIKSCDNDPVKSVSEVIQPASDSIENCVPSSLKLPQNISKKVSKSIGPKRIFKPNVHVQVSNSGDQQEIKNNAIQPLNSTNRKLVGIIYKLIIICSID